MKVQSVLPVAVALCLSAKACLLPEEVEAEYHLAKYGRYPDVSPLQMLARQSQPDPKDTGVPIGTGDRFGNGSIAPRGLATEERDMNSILTPEEITSGLKALAKQYKDVRYFEAPH